MPTLGVKVGKRNPSAFQRVVRILKDFHFQFDGNEEWTRTVEADRANSLIAHLKDLGIRAYVKERYDER